MIAKILHNSPSLYISTTELNTIVPKIYSYMVLWRRWKKWSLVNFWIQYWTSTVMCSITLKSGECCFFKLVLYSKNTTGHVCRWEASEELSTCFCTSDFYWMTGEPCWTRWSLSQILPSSWKWQIVSLKLCTTLRWWLRIKGLQHFYGYTHIVSTL